MPSALSHDPSISTPGASTDNAIVIFDGTGGTGFGNSTILVDSGGNGRIGIAADTDIITVTAETVTIAGKLVATSIDVGDGAVTVDVTQSNHSLTVGMPIKVSGANQYAAAQANSAANAEVVGIVTAVASSSAFTMTLAGEITTATAVPDSTSPGDIVYLSASSAGAVTTTEPSTAGQVSKPIGVVTEANNKMIIRGEVVSSATDSMDLNGTELVLDVDADTSITADTDDQIDIKISGADDFQFTANSFTALTGSTITSPSFITGNSGTIKLMDGDGSNFFTLAANATTTANVNYTWPAADGSSGQVLSTNSSGVLSWSTPSSGPSQAVEADIESETNQDTYIPPDLAKHIPGAAKFWCDILLAGSLTGTDYNVASITDTGVGNRAVVYTTAMAESNYPVFITRRGQTNHSSGVYTESHTTSQSIIRITHDVSPWAAHDERNSVVGFGLA